MRIGVALCLLLFGACSHVADEVDEFDAFSETRSESDLMLQVGPVTSTTETDVRQIESTANRNDIYWPSGASKHTADDSIKRAELGPDAKSQTGLDLNDLQSDEGATDRCDTPEELESDLCQQLLAGQILLVPSGRQTGARSSAVKAQTLLDRNRLGRSAVDPSDVEQRILNGNVSGSLAAQAVGGALLGIDPPPEHPADDPLEELLDQLPEEVIIRAIGSGVPKSE
ncbi:MAG: hypothetical protein AAF683_03340 [Pseudomonadota bacterium]